MERLIDIGSDPVASLLDLLLAQGCQYRERGGLASHGEEFMAEWSKKYLDVILPILEEHYGGHDPDNLQEADDFRSDDEVGGGKDRGRAHAVGPRP